jgi:hypothetical protein
MQSNGQEIFIADNILSAVENRLHLWEKNNACVRVWNFDTALGSKNLWYRNKSFKHPL